VDGAGSQPRSENWVVADRPGQRRTAGKVSRGRSVGLRSRFQEARQSVEVTPASDGEGQSEEPPKHRLGPTSPFERVVPVELACRIRRGCDDVVLGKCRERKGGAVVPETHSFPRLPCEDRLLDGLSETLQGPGAPDAGWWPRRPLDVEALPFLGRLSILETAEEFVS